jgi:hypothetical protein
MIFPSARTIFVTKAIGLPVNEGWNENTASSPCCSEFRLMPSCIIVVGEAISPDHCTVFPDASFVSQRIRMCGFLQRNSTTVPRMLTSFLLSNPAMLWWAPARVPNITINVSVSARAVIIFPGFNGHLLMESETTVTSIKIQVLLKSPMRLIAQINIT